MSIKSQIQSLTEKPLTDLFANHIDENAPISEHVVELIRLNEDASKGYARAASLMEDDQDELLFTTYANQRARFANTLRSMNNEQETAKEEEGVRAKFVAVAESFAAQAHRALMTLRVSMSDSKLRTMLSECLRGDEALIPHYDHAVRASASRSELHDLLTNQRADIKAVAATLSRLINETSTPS